MTIARREFVLGGLMVGALGVAEALRPRRQIELMGERKLAEIVPEQFGPWQSVYDAGLVQPVSEGSLSDQLYDDLLTRRYIHAETGAQMMLLIAYGRSQTDSLQLHRPEACYPAVGLPIVARQETELVLAGKPIPAVALTAQAPNRTEDIVYWTRMGQDFPQTASAQRSDKLRLAMRGYVADGALIRASQIRTGEEADMRHIADFLTELVQATPPGDQAALVGDRA